MTILTTIPTEDVDFCRVNRAPYNPRVLLKPGDREYDALERSLEEFGLVQDLIWNRRSGNLVGGHQRLSVLQARGNTHAPMKVVDLDDQSEKRLNVILNNGGRWDDQKLSALLGDLNLVGIDITHLGIAPVTLNALLQPPKTKRDPDTQAPAKPAIPITRPGDIYELTGAHTHRLLCGDARIHGDVTTAFGALPKARMAFCDPPYNVDYDNSTRGDGRRPLGTINNDAMSAVAFAAFLTPIFRNLHSHTISTAALYSFHADKTHVDFVLALREAGWRFKQQCVWAKPFTLSRSHYHFGFEPVIYAAKDGENCEWFGTRSETTVWSDEDDPKFEKMAKAELVVLLNALREQSTLWREARDPSDEYVHPTQKPVSIPRRALLNSTLPLDVVIDPTVGSGTTIIAAELKGRIAVALENDPGYCDVAVRRFLETFEGAKATRNGLPFTF